MDFIDNVILYKWKKITSFLVCVFLLASSMGTIPAQAALTKKQQNLYYKQCVQAERIILKQYYEKNLRKKAPRYGQGAEYIVFSLARAKYPVSKNFYKQYYNNLKSDLKKKKGTIDPQECAKLVLVLSAMGHDASKFKEYPLLKTMCKKTNIEKSDMLMKFPTILLALDCGNYDIPKGNSYITRKTLLSNVIQGCYGSTRMGMDMVVMNAQALTPYCKKYASAKKAKQYVLNLIYKNMSNGGYIGDNNNLWTNAQVLIFLGQCKINPLTKKQLVKGKHNLIGASLGKINLNSKTHSISFDPAQVARGFTSTKRTIKKQTRLFDCTDVLSW